MNEPLDYRKLVQVIRDVQAMGDKIFHHSTVHKPTVSITTPTVRDNIADFGVVFEWDIPRRDGLESTDKRRWTRVKNIEQFLVKLETAAEGADLIFGVDWRDVEFGIKGGEPLPNNVTRSNRLVMYVSFWVKVAPSYVWARQQQEPTAIANKGA